MRVKQRLGIEGCYCLLISKTVLQFMPSEFQERTKELYDRHVSEIEKNPEIRSDLMKASGLRESSCFNQLQYFHVTEGLPPDIMHDFLEGSLQHELKLLIQTLVQDGVITLERLNERMTSFNYGHSEAKSKPSEIGKSKLFSKDNSLSQSGT